MIRTKGEAGTGDIVNAVTHMRAVFGAIRALRRCATRSCTRRRRSIRAPYELVRWVAENGRLPVVTFTAGGIATPADASLCMQLGADGVFVGSGIFKSGDRRRARRRSSRRRRTSTTPRCSPTSPQVSASRWSASPRARSPRASGSKSAAGRRCARQRFRAPGTRDLTVVRGGVSVQLTAPRPPSTTRASARRAPVEVELTPGG